MSSALQSLPRLRASPTALVRAHRSYHNRTVIPPSTRLRQPLSTPLTKPTACTRSLSFLTPDTTTNTAAAAAAEQPTPKPLVVKFSKRDKEEYHPARLAALERLLGTTPWRITPGDASGVERVYIFASTAQAAAFGERVAERARQQHHDPDWSGCGRRVYVKWTTHHPSGLSLRDITHAEACERISADVVGDGASAGDGGGEQQQQQQQQQHPLRDVLGEGRNAAPELWLPEYRRTPRRNGRNPKEWAADETLRLWKWVRAKALPEESIGKDGEPLAAWSMVFGVACVTQARFVEDESGRLVMAAREHWADAEYGAMKEIMDRTTPMNEEGWKSGKATVMENLLEKAVFAQ